MAPRDVKIVDVVYDPEGPDVAGEQVLIENQGNQDVDLTGWTLRDTATHRRAPYSYRFPRFTLRGGAAVRVHTGAGTNDQDDLYWGRGWGVWNNTGDTAVLLDAAGDEIDQFSFPRLTPAQQRFPGGFLWGVATAAYQVEGNSSGEDWDLFTASQAIRDRVRSNSHRVGLDIELKPAGPAVRHLDQATLEADLDRAAALGVNAYRMSIEWGRLETRDTGEAPLTDADVDATALAYYTRALDAIRARGMQPVVTLNHLVLPAWVLVPPQRTSILGETMEDDPFRASMRGWENAATVDRFIRYASYVVERFKDRVDLWIPSTSRSAP
jgi:hypothetical protein